VEKYGAVRQAADGKRTRLKKIRFALQITKARKQRETLVIFSVYWFSTAVIVTRTRLSVTLRGRKFKWG
jgi:hypothetical protein